MQEGAWHARNNARRRPHGHPPLYQAKQAYETFDTGRTGKVVIVDET